MPVLRSTCYLLGLVLLFIFRTMLKRVYILTLLCCGLLGGCIQNDIPYPTIIGAVEKMEILGQTELKIDAAKRTVNVILADTVDLRKVTIASMKITDEASCTIDSGLVINLTDGVKYAIGAPYKFTISTFQDYDWKIVATQPIKHEIVLSGSIGDVRIDELNCVAFVSVDKGQVLTDMVVEKFVLGPSNAVYSPNPYTLSDFKLPVKVKVSYAGVEQDWTIRVEYSDVNVVTKTPNPWGLFAYVYGVVNPASAAVAEFEYQLKGDADWKTAPAVRAADKISGRIDGLLPNLTYAVRAKLGEEYGEAIEFKTETTPTIPNLDFETYYSIVNASKKTVYYFNTEGDPVPFWATGNPGVTLAGKESNSVPVKGSEARTGTAVKMTTIGGVLIAKIAAGNLFTGQYLPGMPMEYENMKKLVIFGRPYSGRPTSLSGWYKYTSKNVDLAADPAFPFTDSIGKPDWANIYIKLERWPEDWDDSQTTRPAADQVTLVASGDFRTNKSVDAYTKFTIDIKYADLVTRPNHVVLVATSSVNGGDFCGGVGSTLWIDDFSLSFTPADPSGGR